MQSTTIAVDLAKSVFEVAVSRRPGKVEERHRLTRKRFSLFLAQQAPATVVMEACGSAHFWAREVQVRGHEVRCARGHNQAAVAVPNQLARIVWAVSVSEEDYRASSS